METTNNNGNNAQGAAIRYEPYVDGIRMAVRKRQTRSELRRMFFNGTGRLVPNGVNLRSFVSKWHAHQQAINAGALPSLFWLEVHGLKSNS